MLEHGLGMETYVSRTMQVVVLLLVSQSMVVVVLASEVTRCRSDPMWKGMYDDCRTLMQWTPKGDLWNSSSTHDFSKVLQNKDATIRQCLEKAFLAAKDTYPWACCESEENSTRKECQARAMQIRGHYYRGTHEDDSDEIVVLSDVFNEQEAFGLEALDKCIRNAFPGDKRLYEAREFGNETESSYGMFNDDGGNYVTYLNGLLQRYLPGATAAAYQAVQLAYDQSGWGSKRNLPSPSELGTHSAEFLKYSSRGRLSLHVDDESVYTISVALNRFDDYQGGYFRLATGEALFKVPRRSAIVFFGESYHGVTEIENGERNVFVLELWNQPDAPIGSARPQKDDYFQFDSAPSEPRCVEVQTQA